MDQSVSAVSHITITDWTASVCIAKVFCWDLTIHQELRITSWKIKQNLFPMQPFLPVFLGPNANKFGEVFRLAKSSHDFNYMRAS